MLKWIARLCTFNCILLHNEVCHPGNCTSSTCMNSLHETDCMLNCRYRLVNKASIKIVLFIKVWWTSVHCCIKVAYLLSLSIQYLKLECKHSQCLIKLQENHPKTNYNGSTLTSNKSERERERERDKAPRQRIMQVLSPITRYKKNTPRHYIS